MECGCSEMGRIVMAAGLRDTPCRLAAYLADTGFWNDQAIGDTASIARARRSTQQSSCHDLARLL